MKLLAVVVSTGLVLWLGAATIAAPPQADRPGVVVQPKVTIANRGRGEAIPVSVQGWDFNERPVTVQIAGTPTVTLKSVPQPWSYRTVTVPPADDMAASLAVAGADGWEATGVQLSNPSGTVLLLKRPR